MWLRIQPSGGSTGMEHPRWSAHTASSWGQLDAQTGLSARVPLSFPRKPNSISQSASILTYVSSPCSLGIMDGLQEAGSVKCLEILGCHFRCILVVKAGHKTSSETREIGASDICRGYISRAAAGVGCLKSQIVPNLTHTTCFLCIRACASLI